MASRQGQPVVRDQTTLRFAAPQQWGRDGMPTSASLSIKADEVGVSVYVKELLATRALDEHALVAGRPGYGVFALPVAAAQELTCEVVHDPVVRTPSDPIDFAHALLIPPADKVQWKLVRAALLDAAEILIAPDHQR